MERPNSAVGGPTRSLSIAAALPCVIWGLSLGAPASAEERFFTYIHEADVGPKGEWELQQRLTFRKGYLEGDHQFEQYLWDFREEIEYGITDKLSASLELNFQQEQIVAQGPGLPDSSKFSFEGVSGELKYRLLDPYKDPVGIALLVEPTYNGSAQSVDYKLIFSKNIGDHWILAANANFEQEWEKKDGKAETASVLEFAFGGAYRLTPNWSVGLEVQYRSVYEGETLNDYLSSAWFVGPNIHYGVAKWWATFTFLPQIAGSPSDGNLNLTEYQIFEARLIVGINF